MRYVALASFLACASPQPAHTIEPAQTASATTEAHWPDASPSAPPDRTKVIAELRLVHAVAEVWRVSYVDECPTLQRLKDDHLLVETASTKDEWGTPYKIVCDEDETRVVSYGPDRREGTPDDIVYPPPRGDTR